MLTFTFSRNSSLLHRPSRALHLDQCIALALLSPIFELTDGQLKNS